MTRRVRIVRWVLHHLVPQFQAAGWVVVNDMAGTTHGRWSVLMRYRGQ